jgi:CheY-like chemotaxis protein
VESEHDGHRRLARALAGGFDLPILDVMLPELGGFEALRRLRRHSPLPVLMLTVRGAGMGLAIVEPAITVHNAHVTAENCDPGLRVEIRIPRQAGRTHFFTE